MFPLQSFKGGGSNLFEIIGNRNLMSMDISMGAADFNGSIADMQILLFRHIFREPAVFRRSGNKFLQPELVEVKHGYVR